MGAVEILYRCADFIAVNKPPGIAVQGDSDAAGLLPLTTEQLGCRVWLVHRLDKNTSGVLLLAFNAEAASRLAQLFADKTVSKTYLALSDCRPSKKQGWVKGGMAKARNGAWKLTRSAENPAITRFFSRSIQPNCRLFVLQPQTGKTHQLRVAMKSLGSPILGDTLYGGSEAERMFLHAWRIEFALNGQFHSIIAPLDATWPSEISDGLPVTV